MQCAETPVDERCLGFPDDSHDGLRQRRERMMSEDLHLPWARSSAVCRVVKDVLTEAECEPLASAASEVQPGSSAAIRDAAAASSLARILEPVLPSTRAGWRLSRVDPVIRVASRVAQVPGRRSGCVQSPKGERSFVVVRLFLNRVARYRMGDTLLLPSATDAEVDDVVAVAPGVGSALVVSEHLFVGGLQVGGEGPPLLTADFRVMYALEDPDADSGPPSPVHGLGVAGGTAADVDPVAALIELRQGRAGAEVAKWVSSEKSSNPQTATQQDLEDLC
eukprot:TRINITY_DN6532_c1_g2_i1.p1 TRINITY_DN6532_c1_g2~~TRINITY_DN6532_c1_g2_i1.p1  ORF type:complete len:294 (+),score=46.91 TRINITY_DN6532_c1_g2_i1:50-883(+)